MSSTTLPSRQSVFQVCAYSLKKLDCAPLLICRNGGVNLSKICLISKNRMGGGAGGRDCNALFFAGLQVTATILK
jgi:hypothetical protein